MPSRSLPRVWLRRKNDWMPASFGKYTRGNLPRRLARGSPTTACLGGAPSSCSGATGAASRAPSK
eukprot:13656117-Alexandrium_andersonii.AAC.1